MIIRKDQRITRSKRPRTRSLGRRSVWYCTTLLSGFALLITATPLATQGPGTGPVLPSPSEAIHRIEIGDTLSLLAAYYYGDGRQWPRILEANPLNSPNRLTPGQKVWVPLPQRWTPYETYEKWKTRFLAKTDSADAGGHGRKALLLLLILSNSLRPR